MLHLLKVISCLLVSLFMNLPPSWAVSQHALVPPNCRVITPPVQLAGGQAVYYSFQIANGSKVCVLAVNYKAGKLQIVPMINSPTCSVADSVRQTSAVAAINGGYFNLSDGQSASYVVVDSALVADPATNRALTGNPQLALYLPDIFKRSELRIFQESNGEMLLQIAAHGAPLLPGVKLLHSLQGGPRLLPEITDVQEAFVRTDSAGRQTDSIGCRRPAARTAFGITPDGYALMLCVSGKGQDPESSGVTLVELAELMKQMGCSEALNFDGGASSSMFVQFASPGSPGGRQVCGKHPATKVKSVLLLLMTRGLN